MQRNVRIDKRSLGSGVSFPKHRDPLRTPRPPRCLAVGGWRAVTGAGAARGPREPGQSPRPASASTLLGCLRPGTRPLGAGEGGRAPRPSSPRPAGGGPPRARRGSSAPAGAAAGAARATRSGPARRGGGDGGGGGGSEGDARARGRRSRGRRWPVAAARGERGPEAAAAVMPLLFLERFPWPSLRTYTGLSGLALLGTIISAYRALSQPEAGPGEPEPLTAPLQPEVPALSRPGAGGPSARDVAQYLLSDSLFVWVSEAAGGGGAVMAPRTPGGVAGTLGAPGPEARRRRARGLEAGGAGAWPAGAEGDRSEELAGGCAGPQRIAKRGRGVCVCVSGDPLGASPQCVMQVEVLFLLGLDVGMSPVGFRWRDRV